MEIALGIKGAIELLISLIEKYIKLFYYLYMFLSHPLFSTFGGAGRYF